MISAMIHGIYSGDTRKLGVRAIFPGLWEAEREWRSVILFALFGGVWRKYIGKVSEYQLKRKEEEVQTIEVKDRIKSMEGGTSLIESMEVASVWGVKGGLEKLTDTLRDWLKNEGVEFRMGQDGTLESVLKNGSNWSVSTNINFVPIEFNSALASDQNPHLDSRSNSSHYNSSISSSFHTCTTYNTIYNSISS